LKTTLRVSLACAALLLAAGAARGAEKPERKKEFDAGARALFKKLAPGSIKVKKGEERYLAVYEFAHEKLARAIQYAQEGRQSRAYSAQEGFGHYMNQLKVLAFADELKQLSEVRGKLWSDLLARMHTQGNDIPTKLVLTEEVLARIPKEANFLRKFAEGARKQAKLRVSIDYWDDNRTRPRLHLTGVGERSYVRKDGTTAFSKAQLVRVWSGRPNRKDFQKFGKTWPQGGIVRRCKAILILLYDERDGKGVLRVPFEFCCWRQADGKQGLVRESVKVRLDRVFALAGKAQAGTSAPDLSKIKLRNKDASEFVKDVPAMLGAMRRAISAALKKDAAAFSAEIVDNGKRSRRCQLIAAKDLPAIDGGRDFWKKNCKRYDEVAKVLEQLEVESLEVRKNDIDVERRSGREKLGRGDRALLTIKLPGFVEDRYTFVAFVRFKGKWYWTPFGW
jgi:hypothetical protein